MKLLAIILAASLSISSVLPSTGDVTTDHECPEGYEKVGEDCRETAEKISACPANEGDQCYVDDNYCSFGLSGSKVRDLTEYRCQEGFSHIKDSYVCESVSAGVNHGDPEYKCFSGSTEIDDKCVLVSNPVVVCPEGGSTSSPGCLARSYKFNVYGLKCMHNYEPQVNPDGDDICVFKEGSQTTFCHTDMRLDTTTNKCVTKSPWSKEYVCSKGRLIDGRCIEKDQHEVQHLCQLKSDLAGDVGACYKGTVEETNKGVRCLVTSTTLQRVQVCPAGFFEFKNKCVSHLTTITTAASE